MAGVWGSFLFCGIGQPHRATPDTATRKITDSSLTLSCSHVIHKAP